MLLYAVSVLAVGQSSSEILEGLMNNIVYSQLCLNYSTFMIVCTTMGMVHLSYHGKGRFFFFYFACLFSHLQTFIQWFHTGLQYILRLLLLLLLGCIIYHHKWINTATQSTSLLMTFYSVSTHACQSMFLMVNTVKPKYTSHLSDANLHDSFHCEIIILALKNT